MLLFLKIFVIWISIGVLVNIIVNKRIPILSQYSDEDIEDLLFDIKYGPFGPVYFVIQLLKERYHGKDE